MDDKQRKEPTTCASENTGRAKGLANLRPWKKGQSGNPGGRPKGIAAQIRAQTKDGQMMIELALQVLAGKVKATARDRLDAARLLLDRGYGRAIETQIAVDGGSVESESLRELAADQLEELARSLRPTGT